MILGGTGGLRLCGFGKIFSVVRREASGWDFVPGREGGGGRGDGRIDIYMAYNIVTRPRRVWHISGLGYLTYLPMFINCTRYYYVFS